MAKKTVDDTDISKERDEAVALLEKTSKSDDRSCIIVLTAYVEDLLTKNISAVLVTSLDDADEFLSEFSPLGNMGIKTKLAYRLGLISADLYKALRTLSRIRNRCAHEHGDVLFEDSQIKSLVNNIVSSLNKSHHENIDGKTTREKFEDIYTGCFILLAWKLHNITSLKSAPKEPMFG